MSFVQTEIRKENLIGRTDIGRIIYPTIRASNRRSDPDGGSAVPYFTGLNGTSLDIAIAGDVVDLYTVNFSSDSYASAIAAINAVSPVNIKAEDDNGYLRITSLHPGNKNALAISTSTAATIFGFEVDPVPGSRSNAGEIATTATGWPTQSNDQLSSFISYGEGLNSVGVNRMTASAITMIDTILANLDREFSVPKKIDVTVTGGVFTISNPNLADRLNIVGSDSSPITVANPSMDLIDKIISFVDTNDDQVFVDKTRVRVQSVTYGTFVSDATSFTTWGTPDGKSVFGNSAHLLKTKAAASISSIKGNVITATGAQFFSKGVQAGDTVIISGATNNTPFNHNGEFIVDAVYNDSSISIRPKGKNDKTFGITGTPASLNYVKNQGESYGTMTAIVGRFLPMGSMPGSPMKFKLNVIPPNGTYRIIVAVGKTLRTMGAGDIAWSTVYKQFGKQLELGSKLGNSGSGIIPRLISPVNQNDPLTLFAEFPSTGGYGIRIFLNPSGNIAITANASFDPNAGFIKDINGSPAFTMFLTGDNVVFSSRQSAANTAWLSWDSVASFPVADNTVAGHVKLYSGLSLGDGIISDATTALVPRVKYKTLSTDKTLLTESIRGLMGERVYSTISGIITTRNAKWDGANWVKDVNNTPAYRWDQGLYGFRQFVQYSSNTFADSTWTDLKDFREYQVKEDFIDYIGGVSTSNTNLNSRWVTGTVTNSIIGTSTNSNYASAGSLEITNIGNGNVNANITSRFDLSCGSNSLTMRFDMAIENNIRLDTLANSGFFIGLKNLNNIFPPVYRDLLGISAGSDSPNYQLRMGTSDVFTDTDLGIPVNANPVSFVIDKIGTIVNVYHRGTLILGSSTTSSYVNTHIFLNLKGGELFPSRLFVDVDGIYFWGAPR